MHTRLKNTFRNNIGRTIIAKTKNAWLGKFQKEYSFANQAGTAVTGTVWKMPGEEEHAGKQHEWSQVLQREVHRDQNQANHYSPDTQDSLGGSDLSKLLLY